MSGNYVREISLIRKSIQKLELNLSGKTVLTEVGSHNYLFTPIIALLANAEKVYAWTADSPYGDAEEIKENCAAIARELQINSRLIIETNKINTQHIQDADIITNSGFLRPLNENFLKHVKNAVIPLMYEKWELREEDVDVDYCLSHKIKLAGTWESHPKINVFSGVGPLAVKLALDAGLEVYNNTAFIWSDDDFGEETAKAFNNFGVKKVYRSIVPEELYQHVAECDFVYFCNYNENKPIFGADGVLDLERIKQLNPAIFIIHLYGDISFPLLKNNNIKTFPERSGKPSVMTETLGYLGVMPIIDLQVAGFKVGECLLNDTDHDLVQPISI